MNPRTRRLRRHRRNMRKVLHKIATKTASPAVMEWHRQTSAMKSYLETVMLSRLRALKAFKGETP